jgi:hypothetical protein
MESFMQDIYGAIKSDELPPDLALLSKVCGIECIQSLLREFGGLSFYIPKITRIDLFIGRYLKEHKSDPPKKLALDLNVSEQYIKKMLKELRSNC